MLEVKKLTDYNSYDIRWSCQRDVDSRDGKWEIYLVEYFCYTPRCNRNHLFVKFTGSLYQISFYSVFYIIR